jgi:hypothetical protein
MGKYTKTSWPKTQFSQLSQCWWYELHSAIMTLTHVYKIINYLKY